MGSTRADHLPIRRSARGIVVELGGLLPAEAEIVREARWWSMDEMASTDAVILPPALPQFVRDLPDVVRDGPFRFPD